jgi:hypothetical protein
LLGLDLRQQRDELELCIEYPAGGDRIETDCGDELLWLKSDVAPRTLPLVPAPVVIRESNPKPRIPDPIHETQAYTRGNSVSVVILDEYAMLRHSRRLTEQDRRVVGMMQDVGKENHIERLVVERNPRSVENFDGDVGVNASEHVNSPHEEVGPLGLENSGDQAVAATNVENARALRNKLGKPIGQDADPAAKHQPLMQNPESFRTRSNLLVGKMAGSIHSFCFLDHEMGQ